MTRLLVFLLIALVAFGGYVFYLETAEAPGKIEGTPTDTRIMDIETYVRQNISTLSPEPTVLGGTWQVTEIDTADGHGTVWYEDGHIAFVADFEYTIDKYGISVTMFEVRK